MLVTSIELLLDFSLFRFSLLIISTQLDKMLSKFIEFILYPLAISLSPSFTLNNTLLSYNIKAIYLFPTYISTLPFVFLMSHFIPKELILSSKDLYKSSITLLFGFTFVLFFTLSIIELYKPPIPFGFVFVLFILASTLLVILPITLVELLLDFSLFKFSLLITFKHLDNIISMFVGFISYPIVLSFSPSFKVNNSESLYNFKNIE